MAWRPSLRGWLERQSPSVVHLHNPHPPGALLAVARDCLALGIPYVISTHGFVEFHQISRGFDMPFWQRRFANRYIRDAVAQVVRHSARTLMLSPLERGIVLD